MKTLINDYQSKFDVEFFGSLDDYAVKPYPTLFNDLEGHRRDPYANNCRFVFTLFSTVDSTILLHLQRVLQRLEIPNFFIILVTNNDRVGEMLEQIRATVCPGESPIQVDVVDVAQQKICGQTNFNIPDTICLTPWVNVEVTNLGRYKPCCEYSQPITDVNGNIMDANEYSVLDAYNSPAMKTLRSEFLNGECPKGCSRCFADESLGKVSKRMRDNFVYKDALNKIDWHLETEKHISSLDIKLGNTCNLKCRICGPIASSKWNAEVRAHPKLQPLYKIPPSKPLWVEDSNSLFWNSIKELKNELQHIDFTGGEPFLIKSHFSLLTYLISEGVSQNIALHYNTNGTFFNEDMVDIWSQFKHVTVSFSVDNLKQKFEYERDGASWDLVDKNIDQFLRLSSDKFRFDMYATLSALNVADAANVYMYAKSKGLGVSYNWLTTPNALSVDAMPRNARDYAISVLRSSNLEIVEPIIKRLEQDPVLPKEELINTIQVVDVVRKQKFSDVYPELYEALR